MPRDPYHREQLRERFEALAAAAGPGAAVWPELLEALGDAVEPRIDIEADPGKRELVIRDSGAGLTRDEVRHYLATIGSGYTRILRQKTQDPTLVGAFGLGFLSAYVISERVEVTTTSYQAPGETWTFRSRDGLRYSLSEAPEAPIGTTVRLTLRRDHASLAGPKRAASILERYCCLLPTPIHAPEPINAEPPSWRADPTLRLLKLHLETVERFEHHFEPLIAWQIPPADDSPVAGILWLQDGGSWATSDNRRVSIFVRGMLVDDDAPRALPDWAGFAGAAIECNALTPTASRESIRTDKAWQRLRDHLRRAMVDGLVDISRHPREAWRRVVARHNNALRAATLVESELFELLQAELKLPTSEGEMRLGDVERKTPGRVFLALGGASGYEQMIHRSLGQPVLDGTLYGVAAFARTWCDAKSKKLVTLGTREGNRDVFRVATREPERDARLERLFAQPGTEVIASTFAPSSLPVVWVPDHDAELKRRLEDDEVSRRMSTGILGLARQFTNTLDGETQGRLFVNLDAPLVQRLLATPDERAEPAAQIILALSHVSSQDRRLHGTSLEDALKAFSSSLGALLD